MKKDNNRKKELFMKISMILELLLCFGVMSFFRGCPNEEDGSFMPCHFAQLDVFYLGTAMMILSAACLFREKQREMLTVSGFNVILSSIAFLLPGNLVSLCLAQDMRCHVYMQPFVRVCSIFVLISNACAFFSALKEKPDKA